MPRGSGAHTYSRRQRLRPLRLSRRRCRMRCNAGYVQYTNTCGFIPLSHTLHILPFILTRGDCSCLAGKQAPLYFGLGIIKTKVIVKRINED